MLNQCNFFAVISLSSNGYYGCIQCRYNFSLLYISTHCLFVCLIKSIICLISCLLSYSIVFGVANVFYRSLFPIIIFGV